jgi:hypothetical protein
MRSMRPFLYWRAGADEEDGCGRRRTVIADEEGLEQRITKTRVGTIVPILDENVIVNSFSKFPDYRPIHFKMVIDR